MCKICKVNSSASEREGERRGWHIEDWARGMQRQKEKNEEVSMRAVSTRKTCEHGKDTEGPAMESVTLSRGKTHRVLT
jgi:hypothetical protein